MLGEVYRITFEISIHLELGFVAVPVPSEPYEYWYPERMVGRGGLSLRHAAIIAGLGILERNTPLLNEEEGNRLVLGALLIDEVLDGDPLTAYNPCEGCDACIRCCPVGALDGKTVVKRLCRGASMTVTKKGYALYPWNRCRAVCPRGAGGAIQPSGIASLTNV